MENKPQMSTCTRSKAHWERVVLTEKGKQCCLANGQTLQTLLESTETERTKLCNKLSLE
jgi:hypothetical protein